MNAITKIDSFRGEYYFLSNFYEAPVEYDGIRFQNNEAAFQAMKTLNPDIKKTFAGMDSSQAKKAGRKVELRKDWESVKVDIMRDIVFAKFSQNPELKEKLLATGDAYLEEGNTWGDRIWGTVNGKGANLLGQILMDTRLLLRTKELQIETEDIEME